MLAEERQLRAYSAAAKHAIDEKIRAAVEEEREACADLSLAHCGWRRMHAVGDTPSAIGHRDRIDEAEQISAAIRARKEGS